MTPRFIPKPTPARRYLLNGKRVGLAEAARILDVGLATIARHTHADVIDAGAIRALVPCEPFRKAISSDADAPASNRRTIARMVAAIREARA